MLLIFFKTTLIFFVDTLGHHHQHISSNFKYFPSLRFTGKFTCHFLEYKGNIVNGPQYFSKTFDVYATSMTLILY